MAHPEKLRKGKPLEIEAVDNFDNCTFENLSRGLLSPSIGVSISRSQDLEPTLIASRPSKQTSNYKCMLGDYFTRTTDAQLKKLRRLLEEHARKPNITDNMIDRMLGKSRHGRLSIIEIIVIRPIIQSVWHTALPNLRDPEANLNRIICKLFKEVRMEIKNNLAGEAPGHFVHREHYWEAQKLAGPEEQFDHGCLAKPDLFSDSPEPVSLPEQRKKNCSDSDSYQDQSLSPPRSTPKFPKRISRTIPKITTRFSKSTLEKLHAVKRGELKLKQLKKKKTSAGNNDRRGSLGGKEIPLLAPVPTGDDDVRGRSPQKKYSPPHHIARPLGTGDIPLGKDSNVSTVNPSRDVDANVGQQSSVALQVLDLEEMDFSSMPLEVLKRKAAEIKLVNVIKERKLLDLRMEAELEKARFW